MSPNTEVWVRAAIYAALAQAVCMTPLLVMRQPAADTIFIFLLAFPAALLLIPVFGNAYRLEIWFLFAVVLVNWLIYTPFFRVLLLRRKRHTRLA